MSTEEMDAIGAAERALCGALRGLETAVAGMLKQTTPPTPLPRPRHFAIAPGLEWPVRDQQLLASDNHFSGYYLLGRGDTPPLSLHEARNAAQAVVKACNGRPRRLLRALRRIQAATAWCHARAAGRRRAAQEILRQQAGATEVLRDEAALRALEEI